MKFTSFGAMAMAAVAIAAVPLSAQDAAQDAAEPSDETASPPATENAETAPPVNAEPLLAPAPDTAVLSVPPPAPSLIPSRPAASAPRAALPVTQLAAGDAKLEWFQSPVLFFPGKVEPGKATVHEDDRVIEAPLAWAISARLGAPAVIDTGTRQVSLAAGDLLPKVMLKTKTGVDERYALFCTRNKITQKRVAAGLLDKLQVGIEDSLRDAQWCLQDTDGDGGFDTAVSLNDGQKVKPAAPIGAVPYEIMLAEPIPGSDDLLSVSLVRVGSKDVDLVLSIKQRGKAMKFHTLQSGYHLARAFTAIRYDGTTSAVASLLGLRFKVLSADRKANEATLEWQPAVRYQGEFVVIPLELHTY